MSAAFDRPWLIVLILMGIPVFFLLSRRLKPLFTLILPLGPPGGISFKAPVKSKVLMRFLQGLELLGIVFLFIAAAGPHFSYTETLWHNRGVDILFVMDVSPSMAGLDMDGRSRFDVSRELVEDFALRRPSDALGLVAVGQEAALLVPLTTDRDSFFNRLKSLELGELGDGTALGMGLGIACLHIGRSNAPRRAVVLITDGENNAGAIHPETIAALLGDMGVSLYVIGVGSSGEVPINYFDSVSRLRRTGTFESRYDPEVLKNIAAKGKGAWISAPTAEAFSIAFAQLDQAEMTVRPSGIIRRKEPFHVFFIIFGFALVFLARLIRIYILGAFL